MSKDRYKVYFADIEIAQIEMSISVPDYVVANLIKEAIVDNLEIDWCSYELPKTEGNQEASYF